MMKPSKKQLGAVGETLACGYLKSRNYAILHRNWRSGNFEIDIIALTPPRKVKL